MTSQAALDRAFDVLVAAALAGERCPHSTSPDQHPALCKGQVGKLVAEGRISVAIYPKNFRVVTILVGEHTGKTTKPAPAGQVPYLTSDMTGTRRNGSLVAPVAGRQQPSAPRLLSLAELERGR